MGAGDYALIPFGQALRCRLLGIPEGEVLALEPETRMEGVVFRALSAPGSGFPDEAAAIAASRLEEDIVEVHAIESVGEVLGGGIPEPSVNGGDGEWRFAALPKFRKDVWRQPKLFERVANAIVEICKDPDDPARKYDQAPDTRYEWILAIQAGRSSARIPSGQRSSDRLLLLAGATRRRLRLSGGRTR